MLLGGRAIGVAGGVEVPHAFVAHIQGEGTVDGGQDPGDIGREVIGQAVAIKIVAGEFFGDAGELDAEQAACAGVVLDVTRAGDVRIDSRMLHLGVAVEVGVTDGLLVHLGDSANQVAILGPVEHLCVFDGLGSIEAIPAVAGGVVAGRELVRS